jgi:hypothetical protein
MFRENVGVKFLTRLGHNYPRNENKIKLQIHPIIILVQWNIYKFSINLFHFLYAQIPTKWIVIILILTAFYSIFFINCCLF